MNEIKFNPVAGSKSEILYSKPCILTFFGEHIVFRCEFAYSHKQEDEMLPTKEVSVDDMTIYFKKFISSVEWSYSSEGECWFFQIWHSGQNSYWNVESKDVAVGIVENIKKWILS